MTHCNSFQSLDKFTPLVMLVCSTNCPNDNFSFFKVIIVGRISSGPLYTVVNNETTMTVRKE